MEAALGIATQTHLKQQREALLYRQRELRADVHAAALQRCDFDRDRDRDSADRGQPIALKHLRVQPVPPRCASFQATHEHGPPRARS
jgi:RNA polymerase-binding transcription factor DksA